MTTKNPNRPKYYGKDREYKHLYRYGLSAQDYKDMLEKQNNTCAICQETCNSGRRLSVDHCHYTGKIRGLLCMKCNRGLGNLQDSVDILKRAIVYLEE